MIEVLKQALEALEYIDNVYMSVPKLGHEAITSLRQAIKELESQEPDYWLGYGLQAHTEKPFENDTALYTRPPQRTEQEPVAWMFEDDEDNGHKTFRQTPPSPEVVAYLAKWNRPAWVPIYTHPPQRKPLTDEQIEKMRHLIDWTAHWSYGKFARAIEAAHGIKE